MDDCDEMVVESEEEQEQMVTEPVNSTVIKARSYQVELFERACEENTIVCLKTGAGKTFIAVMLIKEFQHQILNDFANGKRTFLLVPKVPLVTQQAKVVQTHTMLKVGMYYGDMGVDYWDYTKWSAELKENQVMVMTPQILVNILSCGYLSMDKINLIIFDECHAAVGSHPYCAVMSRYAEFPNGPRILGLTASVLNGKCRPHAVLDKMEKLEKALHSRIQTSIDLASIQRYATKPREVIVEYENCDSVPSDERELEEVLSRALEKMAPINKARKAGLSLQKDRFKNLVLDVDHRVIDLGFHGIDLGGDAIDLGGDAIDLGDDGIDLSDDGIDLSDDSNDIDIDIVCNDGLEVRKASPVAILRNVVRIYGEMGCWPTMLLVQKLLEDVPKFKSEARDQLKSYDVELYDMELDALNRLNQLLQSRYRTMDAKTAIKDWTAPKLRRLLELLGDMPQAMWRNEFRCIVFVECRITAWVMYSYLTELTKCDRERYGSIKPCYVVGHGLGANFLRQYSLSNDNQLKTLREFRSGQCNVMVATKVVEEGLDVPKCNVVVRFDLPANFCSYVQSMGRARAECALFVLFSERKETETLMSDITTYKVIEMVLNERCHGRKAPDLVDTIDFYEKYHKVEPYYPTGPGQACLSILNSLSLLEMYVNHLPKDRYTQNQPEYLFLKNSKGVVCMIKMPLECSLQEPVAGCRMSNAKDAKRAAALEVCRRLHLMGELNDSLLPKSTSISMYYDELGVAVAVGDVIDTVGLVPGTKRRRLAYRRGVADELSNGAYPRPDIPLWLHVIRIEGQTSRTVLPRSCCFAILSAIPLPEVSPFALYAKTNFEVSFFTASTEPCRLPLWKITLLEMFHQVLFRDVINVVTASMCFDSDLALGSFLVVPVTDENGDKYDIDWSMVARYNNYNMLFNNAGNRSWLNSTNMVTGSVIRPLYGTTEILSKRFVVTEMQCHLSPLSPFTEKSYSSYADYYKSKYNIDITDLKQPLLLAQFAPNALSVLLPQRISTRTSKLLTLIPELHVALPLDECGFQQALFLPSVLHRLDGLLLARCFGRKLTNEAGIAMTSTTKMEPMPLEYVYDWMCKVCDDVIFRCERNDAVGPITVDACIYQALTARCTTSWGDLERFEVMGDSFLKYVVSVFLFDRYPLMNEGCMSMLRTAMVSNVNLCAYSKRRFVSEVANMTAFEPRTRWLPPGYVIPALLSDALVRFQVPNYLWPFAVVGDLKLFEEVEDWLQVLGKRWHESVPATKQSVPPPDTSEVDNGSVPFYNAFTHQLISDKSLADAVEAIVGVILVCCGQRAALKALNWFGLKMPPSLDDSNCPLDVKAPPTALLRQQEQLSDETMKLIYCGLDQLQVTLGYTFRERSFLLQAIVHPSYGKLPATLSYQRLEFLGDAILDYLITMKVYQSYPHLSPGELTDLRSSLVDNTTFAYIAVGLGLHRHIRYCSESLFDAVDRYVKHRERLTHPKDTLYLYGEDEVYELQDVEVPKVLGDLVESVAGAIYLDSGLSLETVWNVLEPFVKDIFAQYSVQLPINPVRKLMEKFPSTQFNKPERIADSASVTVRVHCQGRVFVGRGRTKYVAKQAAAKCALKGFGLTSTRQMAPS